MLIIIDGYFDGRYITPCMSGVQKLRVKYWRVWSGFFAAALNIYFVLTSCEKYYATFVIGSAILLQLLFFYDNKKREILEIRFYQDYNLRQVA